MTSCMYRFRLGIAQDRARVWARRATRDGRRTGPRVVSLECPFVFIKSFSTQSMRRATALDGLGSEVPARRDGCVSGSSALKCKELGACCAGARTRPACWMLDPFSLFEAAVPKVEPEHAAS